MTEHEHESGLQCRAVTDPAVIEGFCRRNPALHIYELGDLDPFFWPDTRWCGAWRSDGHVALAMVYRGFSPHTVLAFDDGDTEASRALLGTLQRDLPGHIYTHVSASLLQAFDGWHEVSRRAMLKMDLRRRDALPEEDDEVETLGVQHADELRSLYARCYPGNWFSSRLLETGHYLGMRRGGELVSVAGVHVYSASQRVAALGNIATRDDVRGQGLARRTTGALCHRLLRTTDIVGLNVQVDNVAAVRCYEGLGFEECAGYEEIELRRPCGRKALIR